MHHPHSSQPSTPPLHPPASLQTHSNANSQHSTPKIPRPFSSRPRDKRDDLEPMSGARSVSLFGEKAPALNDLSNTASRSPSERNPTPNLASPADPQGTGDNRSNTSCDKRPTVSDANTANNSKSVPGRRSLLSISADLVSDPFPSPRSRARLSSDIPDPFNDSKPSTLPLNSASAPSGESAPSNCNRPTPVGPPRMLTSLSSEYHSYSSQRFGNKSWQNDYNRGSYRSIPKGRESSQHSHHRSPKNWRPLTESGSACHSKDNDRSAIRESDRNGIRPELERGRGPLSSISDGNESEKGDNPSKSFNTGNNVTTSNEDLPLISKTSRGRIDKSSIVRKERPQSIPEVNFLGKNNEPHVRDDVKKCALSDEPRHETGKEKCGGSSGTGLRSVAFDAVPSPSKCNDSVKPSFIQNTMSLPKKELSISVSPGEGCTNNVRETATTFDNPPRALDMKQSCQSSPSNRGHLSSDANSASGRFRPKQENDEGRFASFANMTNLKCEREYTADILENHDRKSFPSDHLNAKTSCTSHEPHTKAAELEISCSPTKPNLSHNFSRTDRDMQNSVREDDSSFKIKELSFPKQSKPEVQLGKCSGTLRSDQNRHEGLKRKHSSSSLSASADKSPKKRLRQLKEATDANSIVLVPNMNEKGSPKPVNSEIATQPLSKAESSMTDVQAEPMDATGTGSICVGNLSGLGLDGNKHKNSKAQMDNEGMTSKTKELVPPASSTAPPGSEPIPAPVPMFVPTLSLLLATSPRGRSRTSGIEGALNSLGRFPASKTPPLSGRFGTGNSNTPSGSEEREKIFRDMRDLDEKTRELENKIASLKKKATKRALATESCNDTTAVKSNIENETRGKVCTNQESRILKDSFSLNSNSEIPTLSKNRVQLPMHGHLRLILVQNQAKANAANAALRELCHDTTAGLDAQPMQWKASEHPTSETLAKIADEIACKRQEVYEQKRRLYQEYGHLRDMWLNKLKIWKEKRSKEKREACKERDRQLLLSTRGQSALLTSRTSSGRMSTKIVPFVSGNGVANGSAELDAMLADIEAEGGTPGLKEIWSRTLATVPDCDVGIRNFDCTSTLVENPIESLSSSRCINPWMLHEIVIFLEKFTTFPKNFKKIAGFLGHKSTQECARFYFDNKLHLGLKQLVKEASTLKRKGLLRSHIVEIAKKRPSSNSSVVVAVKNGEVIRTNALQAVEMYVNDREVQLIDDARGVEEVEYRKEMMEERRETVGYAMKLSERIRREWCGVDLAGIEHGQFMAAFRKFGTDWKALRTMLGAERVSSVQVREYYRMHWRRIEAEVVTKLVAAKRGRSEKSIGKSTSVVSPRCVAKKTSAKSMEKTSLPASKTTAGSHSAVVDSIALASKAVTSTVATVGPESTINRRPQCGKVPSDKISTIETGKEGGTVSRRNNGWAEQDIRHEGNPIGKSTLRTNVNLGNRVDNSNADGGKRKQERSGDDESCDPD